MRGARLIVVVPHTHWDLEWYEPAARFRQRLVPVLDDVLDLIESGALACFLLDGQTVLAEDYLAVRPEAERRVRALARAGKLLLGPWYVLADELVPADETLVRNLFAGRAAGRRLGHWLAVGYAPDAFGHPAALPAILRGFGIAHAILWRGYGGEAGRDEDLFRWVAPDGASVLVHHLPPAGYETGATLPAEPRALARRWETLRRVLEPRARDRPLLLLNGADHHAPQPDLARAVRRLGRVARGYRVVVASPAAYFAALPSQPAVPEIAGELRCSPRHAWALQGVHASRSRLKQAIAEGERLLLRWAEPQAALAWLAGGRDRRAELRAAWREHLRNCFHDTLAGTVTDDVAADAAARAGRVRVAARGILADALLERLGQDPDAARGRERQWTPTLAIVNPSPRVRTAVVEATVTLPRRRIVVGRPATRDEARAARAAARVRLLDDRGRAIPVQLLGRAEGFERLIPRRAYPVQHEVVAYRVALHAAGVPAFGLRAYRVRPADGEVRARLRDGVRARGAAISGAWCRVSGERGSGFSLSVRGGRGWTGWCALVSERDAGDLYTYEPVPRDAASFARWGRARAGWRGPLVATLARPFAVRGRTRGVVHARLDAGSRLVRIVVEGENLAGGHRLRIGFPLGAAGRGGRTVADMAYGPTVRRREERGGRDALRERPVTTAPMHRYVSVPGAVTVFARGLYEYELTADGTLLVTLFRAVDALSRGDLGARPGHAAWPAATPGARELGPFRAELAVALDTVDEHAAPERWDAVERLAEEFHVPLAGLMLGYGVDVPARVEGPELAGAGLGFKAAKIAEDGTALIVRVANLTSQEVRGEWRLSTPARAARLVRLDERALRTVKTSARGRRVPFRAPPRAVVTLRLEP